MTPERAYRQQLDRPVGAWRQRHEVIRSLRLARPIEDEAKRRRCCPTPRSPTRSAIHSCANDRAFDGGWSLALAPSGPRPAALCGRDGRALLIRGPPTAARGTPMQTLSCDDTFGTRWSPSARCSATAARARCMAACRSFRLQALITLDPLSGLAQGLPPCTLSDDDRAGSAPAQHLATTKARTTLIY